jgi:putative DNA primase/helicase
MGAGKWEDHYNETFRDRRVVIIPDNDKPGDSHAEEVAAAIFPVAQSVKVLHLPDLPERGDASDFFQAGGTIEQLDELIKTTPTWSPPVSESWPALQPLPAATPPVPTLPPELLPEPLRDWLVDIAERAPVPLEFVAMSALSGLGAVIGRQVGIHPAEFDDYLVVPNLWSAIVGRPGTKKSHAVSEGLIHVRRLETEAAESYEAANASREAEQVRIKVESDNLQMAIKRALTNKDDDETDALQHQLTELIERRDAVAAPARRYLTQDATVEKLGVMLKENPSGILIFRDELAGWIGSLDKMGREGDREFYLESWNGTGSFNVDRIGRGSTRIPALTLTLCGGIQPGKLKRYISEAVSGGGGADGLLQRIQLLVWPDDESFPVWEESDQRPDKAARRRAWSVYQRLADIELPIDDGDESSEIPALHFTLEAQALHTAWRSELETRLRYETADTPAFESHLSKYRSLGPALALVCYLAELPADDVIGEVSLDALKKALALCEFLETHARKVFALELNPGLASAYALSRKIKSGTVHDGDTVREIYRHGWTDLTESKDAFAAVEVLERHGWVRFEREGTGGRTKDTLSLHPELRGKSNG